MKSKIIHNFSESEQQLEYHALMQGLERSKFEKGMILPLIENAQNIIEVGCGNGVVLDLLSHNFPSSKVWGVDLDPIMCEAANKRGLSNVQVICAEAVDLFFAEDESVDVVVFCSTLHEIFSHGGPLQVTASLHEAARVLRPGGSVIIRDTVKPSPGTNKISFKKEWVKRRFYRYLNEYQLVERKYEQLKEGQFIVENSYLFEFLTKYFYEIGWEKELQEVYGYYTEEEFQSELQNVGFEIVQKHSYLLPYFREKWSKDIIFNQSFDTSTIIIKAEKVQKVQLK